MRKLTLLLFVAILLTACGTTPQVEPTEEPTQETVPTVSPPPTETPVEETRITSAETLVGIWKTQSGDYIVLHYFNADGTMKVYVSGVGDIGSGPYVFSNGLLKFQDTTGDCTGIVATYEVYGINEDSKLTQLRFVLIGDDACADRRKTLDGKFLIIQPAPSAAPSETRVTAPESILGKWIGSYDGEPIQMEFVADNTVVVRWVGVDGPPISVDPFHFENDLLVFFETEGCGVGKYEVYATYEGGQIVKLRFVLVGEDACKERKGTMAGKTFLSAAP